MRFLVFFPLILSLTSRRPGPSEVNALLDELDRCVQQRFANPEPMALGMSRIARPPSFGRHYSSTGFSRPDFVPENPQERNAVAAIEKHGLQVGLYVFGRTVTEATAEAEEFRAFKGPAAVTGRTARPARYPGRPNVKTPTSTDTLPDWQSAYPLAQRAMQSFRDGGRGFETDWNGWHVVARPVFASATKCVACHNNAAYQSDSAPPVKLGDPLGGVLYAYRARPAEPSAAAASRKVF